MAIILSTPHSHTRFVDGRDTPEDMVRQALKCGCRSFGFSEHGHEVVENPCGLSPEDVPRYIAQVRELQEMYRDRIRVWLGIERDFFSTADPAQYDYVIASAHYLDAPWGEVAVDGKPEDLVRYKKEVCGGDGVLMARNYFDRLADSVKACRPDIIGHFDLLVKTNAIGEYFDESDEEYLQAGYRAMDVMIGFCDMLEINTGGMARGYRDSPYPGARFLEYWRHLGGRAILSSDSHRKETILYGYDKALSLAKRAGYHTLWALGTQDALFEEYDIS
ncbi:MAG: histidinol-phosphatase HisJ family protein [Christensenellales bacterium]|jgi:histidinol-phosphatase (PHP family)